MQVYLLSAFVPVEHKRSKSLSINVLSYNEQGAAKTVGHFKGRYNGLYIGDALLTEQHQAVLELHLGSCMQPYATMTATANKAHN
jgi:hypothetical protein